MRPVALHQLVPTPLPSNYHLYVLLRNLMDFRYLLTFFLFLAACSGGPEEENYLARVGDRTLTIQDIDPSLSPSVFQEDSSEALQQIVEGWVKDELIAQEAIRQGLQNDSEVQRLLAENERQVLVSAFINKIFNENLPEPTEEEIEAYYAQNVDQLTLREDYVRVRYVSTESLQEANEVRNLMRDATVAGNVEESWSQIVETYAMNPGISLSLSAQFYPKSVLFSSARLKAVINDLAINQISAPLQEGNAYHVIQLADSRSAGTTPELSWVRDELKQRLTIDTRKQLIARQVQRLRTEALAQEDLEVRYMQE